MSFEQVQPQSGTVMNNIVSITEILFSSWILSNAEGGKDSIPDRMVFTYALKKAVDGECFPDWLRKELHFVDGRTGLVCLELPEIERCATKMKLTSDPNPSYRRTIIEVGPLVARRRLALLEVNPDDAVRWGQVLRSAAAEAEDQVSAVH